MTEEEDKIPRRTFLKYGTVVGTTGLILATDAKLKSQEVDPNNIIPPDTGHVYMYMGEEP